jgi:gentisate 1,2-dioxygenase
MDKVNELNRELEDKNLLGFWTIPRGERYEPKSSFEPYLWRWADISAALDRAAEVIGPEMSLRRFIGFRNPSLKPRLATTHTMALGVQYVKPHEIAEAHHHTMGAIRFVIKGGGAETTVNGEPFPMETGDFLTTPSLTWHDHYNGSDEPVIWLDGNDNPLIKYLEIGFGKRFTQRQQPHSRPVGSSAYELGPARPSRADSESIQPPPYRYPWEATEKALMALQERPGDPFDGLVLQFVDPLRGGSTLPTMECHIQMLRPQEETRSHRHTSSAVFHVFRGKGFTVVDDARYEWEEGDSFCLPHWRWHRHGSSSRAEAILFAMSDRPVMEALGFYKEEAAPEKR